MKYITAVNPETGRRDWLRYYDGKVVYFTDIKKRAIGFGDEASADAMLALIKDQASCPSSAINASTMEVQS